MTITYPRDLLDADDLRAVTMRTLHQQLRAPSRGGNPGVATVGRDLWQFDFDVKPMPEVKAMAWEAWLSSLRGGARTFRARHPLRRYLLSRPAGYGGLTRYGGGVFDGTATVSSVGVALDTVTIGTLPVGLVFSPGDLLSVTYTSGLQALHRVIEAATSTGGGLATLTVEPTIVPGMAAGNAVQLADPWCLAVLDAGTPAMAWLPGRRTNGVKFSATQAF